MATLYKRGNLWWARWYRTDGKRVSASTKTDKKRDAERIGAELEAKDRKNQRTTITTATRYTAILEAAAREAREGLLTPKRAEDLLLQIRRVANPDLKVPTIYQTLDSWVQDMDRRVKPSTARGYKDMQTAVTAAIKDKPLPDLTHDDCRKLLHGLKDGRSAATANMHFKAFRRAIQSAVQAQAVSSNPALGIAPLPETDSTEKAPFTIEEVQQMLAHPQTSEEWRGAILIAAHTGLRLGDVARLGSSHVEGSRIIIRPKKTERNRRMLTVPLTPQVKAWITGKQGLFFPTLATAKKGTLSTQFTRIMERSGIEQPASADGQKVKKTFHSLRHTFTSWLANAEVPQDVRQKLTGHSDAGIHGRYSHHEESLDEAIGKLPTL